MRLLRLGLRLGLGRRESRCNPGVRPELLLEARRGALQPPHAVHNTAAGHPHVGPHAALVEAVLLAGGEERE